MGREIQLVPGARTLDGYFAAHERALRTLQLILLGLAVVVLVLGVALARLSTDVRHEVFVVKVDSLGFPSGISSVATVGDDGEALERFLLLDMVRRLRGVEATAEAQRELARGATPFLTESGSRAFSAYWSAETGPKGLVGKVGRHLEVQGLHKEADGLYEVRWVEVQVDLSTRESVRSGYRGSFRTLNRKPTTQRETARNPAGFFITDFQIMKQGEVSS